MKKNLTPFAVFLFTIATVLSSCSGRYNLALIGADSRPKEIVQRNDQKIPQQEQKEAVIVDLPDGEAEPVMASAEPENPVMSADNIQVLPRKPVIQQMKRSADVSASAKEELKIAPAGVGTKEKARAEKLGQRPSDEKLLLAIIAILIPPLAVALYEDDITSHFWIDLILTLLFWLPGAIYALWIIFKK